MFVWVYLKEICFFMGCFYLVFILQNFGSLAPFIFFKQSFYIKIYFLSYETLHVLFLQTYIFFQNIKLSFIKTTIFNIKQFNISMGYNLNFLSNNINGLNSSKKRIKIFQCFREKIGNNWILFLQKTHSSHDTIINWRDNFKGELCFSHEATNLCGVITEFLGSNKIKVNRIKNDNQGRILMVHADIDEETFLLINL